MTNPNDPAFTERNEYVAHQMMPDGKPCACSWGLTKREYFAAMALIARSIVPNGRLIVDYVKEAVEMADALIAELNKTGESK